MPKNRYSIKCEVFTSAESRRKKVIDGPWKPTVDEAVKALSASLTTKGMGDLALIQPFVAERADEATAPSKDVRGVTYKTVAFDGLNILLRDVGLKLF